MTLKQPPRIATWMLKHFGSGPNNDVVLGDLAEQYQLNGSALWYWRQSLKAIPVSLFKELRDHAWIAAASMMTGWVLWYVWLDIIIPGLSDFFFGASVRVDFELSHPIDSALAILCSLIDISFINQPFSDVYSVVLTLIAWAICARMVRVVSSIYFDHNAAVILFAGATLLLNLLLIGSVIFQLQQQPQGPPAAWLYSYVGYLAMNVTASILGILIGGGLLRDRSTITS